MITSIPLNKLAPSPRNVRRSADDQANLQLKADIEARGLLQNLVVTPAAKPRGRFAVEAGGRRLHALQLLAKEGKIAKTHEVCCLILDDAAAAAQEVSLAENFQRLSMNPADECLAFQQLIEHGSDVEGIARRFGLTVRFVEGRLRLAALAPAVFEALGSGEISLDAAKAYAATPDQERQAQVFDQMRCAYGGARPDSIRRMMTQATACASDRRALFVGEDAYVAAGGRVERDLFEDGGAARWLDVAILERLACEKMEALAAEKAAETGFGWVRPSLDAWIGGARTRGLRRVPVEVQPMSDEDSALVDELEAEIEDIALGLGNEETDEAARDEAEAKIRELGDRIESIVNKPPVLDDALKAGVGAFLILDEHGRPQLDTALYAEEPAETEPTDPDGGEGPDTARANPAKAAGLSQRLVDELAMQRRDILAAHVAADPGLALDLAIFLMIDREAGYRCEKSGSSLIASPPSNPVVGFETPDDAATITRAQTAESLDRSWVEGETRAARFDAFRALPDEARAAWLGHAVARTLEASLNIPGERACVFHDHLGRILKIDVARWWRPSGINYFDRVPKSVTLAALAEVGGEALSGRYASAKKAELAQACERIFSGDFIADAEVKQAASAWVPEAMRFPGRCGDKKVEGEPVAATPARAEETAEESGGSIVDDRIEEAA